LKSVYKTSPACGFTTSIQDKHSRQAFKTSIQDKHLRQIFTKNISRKHFRFMTVHLNETTFHLLPQTFAIVRLQPDETSDKKLPLWLQTTALASAFLTISKSESELSVVCDERCVPESITDEAQISHGWRAMRLGTMDLSLVGIAARFTQALAAAGVNVNVIATFDTDYIFIQDVRLTAAVHALKNAGYTVVEDEK
jgi:uncharacterized protein